MEHITSRDGTTIGWREAGSGPPLLLVHGTTADHTRWAGVSPRLEEHFTVCAMDRRGRGASTDTAPYDIRREAEDVAAVAEALGEPVAVVGHSYGAVCSLEAALLTGTIDRMVLYEPPIPTGLHMYPPGVPDRMQELLDAGELEATLEVFFREVVRMPPQEFEAYRRLAMWEGRIALAATIPRELAIDRAYAFRAEDFADLDIPVRLLLGGDSPPLFQDAVAVAAAALPNSTVVTLAGQQHIAMDTDPDLFVGAVLDYLLGHRTDDMA